MEQTSKIMMIIAFLLSGLTAMGASKNAPPDDIPTIEALIDAHKKMKKAEDLAVKELSVTVGTQTFTQKAAAKYNDTRKMLNQRLADVGSAATLASSLITISLQLRDLAESYADFTVTTYKNAQRQPFLLLTYASANLQIAWEIKHITRSCVDFAGFQSNVLKATMEEKRQILGFIQMHIASVQRIINRVSMQCRSMLAVGVQEYHVYEIINSKANQEIMNKIIGKWKANAG